MLKLNYPAFWDRKGFISFLLYPFTFIFLFLGFIRKVCVKKIRFNYPVICVGNANIGGAGKTPMIKALARFFAYERKKKIVIISKGYGGNYLNTSIVEKNFTTCFAGDEAMELVDSLYNIGDITVLITKKIQDSQKLVNQIKPDLILVDDGMQNPGFYKDFILLIVDGIRGFGNNMLIPAGPMRQNPHDAIKVSDIVVCPNPSTLIDAELKILGSKKYLKAEQYIINEFPRKEKIFLVCGIGNPEKFMQSIKMQKNLIVVGHLYFSDHHKYTQHDIDLIIKMAKQNQADKIFVTEKDNVKLKSFTFAIDLEVIKIEYSDDSLKNIVGVIDEKLKI